MSGNQIWYVAINDEQVGPLSEEEVRAEIEAGNVSAETFIWRDGLDDWVSVYVSCVFNVAISSELAEAAGDSADAFFASLGGGAAPADDDAAFAAAAAAATSAPRESTSSFGSESSGISSSSSLASSRNESSVLFSLDELASSTKKPSVVDSAATEGSGLIDLSALAATGNASASRAQEVSAPVLAPPAASAAPVIALAPPKKSSAPMVLGLIAALVIAGLVGAILFVMNGRKPEEPTLTAEEIQAQVDRAAAEAAETARAAIVAEQAAQREQEAAAAAAAAAEAEAAAAAEARAAAEREAAEAAERERSGRDSGSSSSRSSDSSRSSSSTRTSGSSSGSSSGSGGDSVSAALAAIGGGSGSSGSSGSTAAPEPSGGGALSDTQIRTTIRRYNTQINRCSSGPDSAGQYRVRFTINPNGSTSGASAQGGGSVGDCVAGVVGSMRFPESGSSRSLTYTFAIR